METKSVTYREVLRWNDDQALDFIERRRWPNGPICPKCGTTREPYSIRRKVKETSKNKISRLYRCKDCKKDFTATVGTIFEGSHIPLSTWLAAIFDIVQSKKGISAHQLHRRHGITYKSALFMAHRIRLAMGNGSFEKLSGVVEADVTYVGGKTRRGHPIVHERTRDEIEMGWRKPSITPGQPHPRTKKTVVLGAVERGGRVRTQVVKTESAAEVRPILAENVDLPNTHLMTDKAGAYRRIKDFGRHDVINHEIEYVRGDIHTQTIEGYWSLLKRGIVGTFHHVSPHRLPMYLNEFEYRWNERHVSDGERFEALLGQMQGRLRWNFRQDSQG